LCSTTRETGETRCGTRQAGGEPPPWPGAQLWPVAGCAGRTGRQVGGPRLALAAAADGTWGRVTRVDCPNVAADEKQTPLVPKSPRVLSVSTQTCEGGDARNKLGVWTSRGMARRRSSPESSFGRPTAAHRRNLLLARRPATCTMPNASGANAAFSISSRG
jgi:hypothetical protein